MTFQDAPFSRLPDPDRQAEFYAEVPMKRLVAFFFDVIIIVVLSGIVAVATLGLGAILFFGIGGFLYRVLTLTYGSATWGMALMGIELRRHDGDKFAFWDAVMHTGAFYISFGVIPLQVLSAILMLSTARGQGLTDMLFGTVALNRRAES